MSFSSPESSSASAAPQTSGGKYAAAQDHYSRQTHPSFGDRLGTYLENRYPIMGGLAEQVFGNQQQQAPIAHVDPLFGAPPPQPDPNLLAMNAQPKTGMMTSLIKSLLMG